MPSWEGGNRIDIMGGLGSGGAWGWEQEALWGAEEESSRRDDWNGDGAFWK